MNTEAQILAQSYNSFSRRHCRRFLFSPKTPPRQTMILQNEPNFQSRPPAERRPRTYFQPCATFHPITFTDPLTLTSVESLDLRSWCGARGMILQNKPNFQARRPAERRPRTYFQYHISFLPVILCNPSTLNPEQSLVLRSWCGAKRMIMQNEPNFQKSENVLNPLSRNDLRKYYPLR